MKITEAAADKVKEIMEQNGGGFAGILISFEGGYKLDLVRDEDADQYIRVENPLLGVFASSEHVDRAEKAQIEFVTEGPDERLQGDARDDRRRYVPPGADSGDHRHGD